MSISVKSVYNTVLYAINKEQRGYVGPDEFNKFAKMAQLKIFEQYFSDLAHMSLNPKGKVVETGYSNLVKILEEKINVFAVSSTLTATDGVITLPTNLYRLDTVYGPNYTDAAELKAHDIPMVLGNDLMAPTATFPRFVRNDRTITLHPNEIESATIVYIKTPSDPYWGYNDAVSNATDGNLFFDAAASTDFELHESEEYRLVWCILEYAGLSTKEGDVVQYANQAEQLDMQVKKG